tara:strand:- start:18550 stop:18930 length:381 start_codon:yes stop_codon:yes gene_type:complete
MLRLISAILLVVTLGACGDGGAQAVATITAGELSEQIKRGAAPLILDVRTPSEFEAGHVPGAINIPHDTLADRLGELNVSTSDEVVVYCHGGGRAGMAEGVLIEAGYSNVVDLQGHWKGWTGGATQ